MELEASQKRVGRVRVRRVGVGRGVGSAGGDGGTDLEEIDTTLAAVVFRALHPLDAFSDGILDVGACEVSWWGRAENTPFCRAKDLVGNVGGKG